MPRPNEFSPTKLYVGIFSVAGCCFVIGACFALAMSPWTSKTFFLPGWPQWILWGVLGISGNALPASWVITLTYFLSHRNATEGGPSPRQIILLRIVLAFPIVVLVMLMVATIVGIASIKRWN